MQKRFFAADDWGFSPGINDGILALARMGCLRNVSLAANSDHLLHGLDELLSYAASGVGFSLHFNLTYGKPLAEKALSLVDRATGHFLSHKRLLYRALLNGVAESDIRCEFEAQLQRLRALKVPVTGVDGHHHVHLIPPLTRWIQRAAAENNLLRFRLMTDPQHLPSYLQTLLCSKSRSDLQYEECHYLRPDNLASKSAYLARINTGQTLLAHPAAYDDFTEAGMTDGLRTERVHELQKIIKFSEAPNA